MHQPSQGNIGGGTGETFGAGQFDGRHSQPFNISGVSNRSHGDAIVDFKNLLTRTTSCKEQDAVAITQSGDGAARSQLRFDVFAPVGNRLDPAIRLFDHATVSLKTAAILLSGKVAMPSRDTILISG